MRLALALLLAVPSTVVAQGREPLVEFENMTWVEVKEAIAAGKTTALFYTGGTEQRGPHNTNGGHTFMARATVKAIADWIVVMHQGRIVQQGPKRRVLTPPHHAYTELLLSSVPEMDPRWLDGVLARRAEAAKRSGAGSAAAAS